MDATAVTATLDAGLETNKATTAVAVLAAANAVDSAKALEGHDERHSHAADRARAH